MIFTWQYEQHDWGTERNLSVYDAAGKLIGLVDPFWPAGIPVDPKRRLKRIVDTLAETVRCHVGNVGMRILTESGNKGRVIVKDEDAAAALAYPPLRDR